MIIKIYYYKYTKFYKINKNKVLIIRIVKVEFFELVFLFSPFFAAITPLAFRNHWLFIGL